MKNLTWFLKKLANRVFIFLIRIYQTTTSPDHGNLFFISYPGRCRFYPTCSEYAVSAVRQYGLFKGIVFSLIRILKCNPFYKGGYDPVVKK